jgi:hypothetical protein
MAADVKLAAARHVLRLLPSDTATELAHELLQAGVYSYSLGELATLRHPIMSDVGPLFESALKELGFALPSREAAAKTVAQHYICGIVEGAFSCWNALSGFMHECYWPLQSEDVGNYLFNTLGCQRLVSEYWAFDYLQELANDNALQPRYVVEQLTIVEQRVLEFGEQWIREQFGNSINPAWRTPNVVALTQSIYDDRAFERMPILADALEDAGCDNADILEHCRRPSPTEHVRGCWVVDLILGKA